MVTEQEQNVAEEETAALDAVVEWDGEVLEEEKTESYGDAIIEGFSAHSNVPRLAKLTGLSQGVVTYIFAVIYFIVGVLCVTITDHIADSLPYIVGSMMIVIGIGQFIIALIRHEYRQVRTNQTATSLIITALGVMILIEHINPQSDWPITFIAIVWGILGLFEAAHAFNHALSRIAHSERCVYFLIKGLIECIVAFMLLYQPDNHDIHRFHIIVFGVNLIFDSITMLPPVKAFLTMK